MVNIFRLQTTQGASVKQLIECLAPLLTDVNFTFTPKHITKTTTSESEEQSSHSKIGGVIIKEINKQSTILVHCKLDADKFDTYEYNYHKKELQIGISLSYLVKALKCMNNFDTMTWEINDDNLNELCIIFETKTKDRIENKKFRLNLMDIDNENLEIEPVNFSYLVIMPSHDFQKYCKDMSLATDKLELICNKDKLTFKGKGDLGSVEFETQESLGGLQIQMTSEENIIVQGIYDLKYLSIFTKCTNLCNNVNMYLKNDYPLVIEYSVAALGKIKLVLSPSNDK
tara:strand:+ start:378 stop:1232 length:855 start_codon:yes stop_codon:yes gene_type:complete